MTYKNFFDHVVRRRHHSGENIALGIQAPAKKEFFGEVRILLA
jgi:hypothetical protein